MLYIILFCCKINGEGSYFKIVLSVAKLVPCLQKYGKKNNALHLQP